MPDEFGDIFSLIVELFRSPGLLCFSVTPLTVNVQRELAAAPFAIPAPGDQNRRFAVPVTYCVWLSGRAQVTSL